MGAIALFYCVALADAASSLNWLGALRPLVGPVIGTHGALVLAGALLGVLLKGHLRDGGSAWRFAARALGYAAALGVAGLLLRSLNVVHPAFIVSKNHATVPWGLVSSALTCACWVVVFVLVDVLGRRRLASLLHDRGREPARGLPDGARSCCRSSPSWRRSSAERTPYQALGATTGIGLVRSAVFAWLVVRLSGWMRSRGVRVQL